MNGRFAALTASFVLTAACLTSVARASDPGARAFREAREYTVRIRTTITTPFIEDARGSFQAAGFLVDAKRGWIVTNTHVVGQSPSTVEVAFAGEPYRPARKVYVDSFADIAVLAIDGLDARHVVAILNPGEPPSIGEPIGAYGHPLGIPFTGSRGIVSATTDMLGPDLIQIDATVDHGNSGGPVISMRDGRVVGIATAGVGGDKSDQLNFATPSRDVCRILDILRRGGSPTPPQMSFAFLKDEDDRHTLRVAQSFDPEHWPFEPGDQVLGLRGERDDFLSLSDFVNALRGREGQVELRIERDGEERTLAVVPVARLSILDRRALMIDGALIAPFIFEDEGTLSSPFELMVHSVEEGSVAEALRIESYDMVQSIDGRIFDDLGSLAAHLQARPDDQPLDLVLRRWSGMRRHVFDFHTRELPGTEIRLIGDEEHVSAAQEPAPR